MDTTSGSDGMAGLVFGDRRRCSSLYHRDSAFASTTSQESSEHCQEDARGKSSRAETRCRGGCCRIVRPLAKRKPELEPTYIVKYEILNTKSCTNSLLLKLRHLGV